MASTTRRHGPRKSAEQARCLLAIDVLDVARAGVIPRRIVRWRQIEAKIERLQWLIVLDGGVAQLVRAAES